MIKIRWTDRSEVPLSQRSGAGWRLRRAAGRALLNGALADLGAQDVGVTRRPPWKPVLDSNGLHFSTSHSGDLSVCAVAEAPIGIDLETTHHAREQRLRRGLPPGFFTNRERREIAEQPTRMLEIFVLKEAWSKRDGRGVGIGFGGFDEFTLRAAHDDLDFTQIRVPGSVCFLAHPKGAAISLRRSRLTPLELVAATATDQKERAA